MTFSVNEQKSFLNKYFLSLIALVLAVILYYESIIKSAQLALQY